MNRTKHTKCGWCPNRVVSELKVLLILCDLCVSRVKLSSRKGAKPAKKKLSTTRLGHHQNAP